MSERESQSVQQLEERRAKMRYENLQAPSTFPNPRNDDPWDNDAVSWLLTQPGGSEWAKGALFEALRRQPTWVRDKPQRVADAERLARRHGVRQVELPRGRTTITRIERTDQLAPRYPTR